MRPALVHGHFAFIYPTLSTQRPPIYINMIRRPLARLVSYWYFLRQPDTYNKDRQKVSKYVGSTETFDECVKKHGKGCAPEDLWVQIPYFCGHHADCWKPGNAWALQQARENVVRHYLLVGVTEEMGAFLTVLQQALPGLIQGEAGLLEAQAASPLRQTYNKTPPSKSTVDLFHQSQVWQMENEFYEFVLNHFHYVQKMTFELNNGDVNNNIQRKFWIEQVDLK